MKKFIALIFASVILFSCSEDNSIQPDKMAKYNLSDELEVGSQPAEIYFDKNTGLYHVFCLGKDLNYNGLKDAEDENPSWWIINKDDLSQATKRIDFDFGNMGFPFRPFIDFANNRLYISQNNLLKIYDLNTSELINQYDIPYNATGISVDDDIIYLSVSKSFDTPGELESYDLNTFEKIGSVTCGYSISQNLIFAANGQKYIATISQGNGSDNSILDIFKIDKGKFIPFKKFENLGNFANHITISNNELFVTINGSHKIYVIDLNDFNIKNTISTQTEGFNGPREVAILNDKYLFTTTYDKRILVFDKNTGTLLDSYSLANKSEGLAFGNNNKQLLVAEINDENYAPVNRVAVFLLEEN